jgi:hypothetical protein
MYGRRGHIEEFLDICLRWRVSVDFTVVVDEGQVLTLLLSVFRFHPTCSLDALDKINIALLLLLGIGLMFPNSREWAAKLIDPFAGKPAKSK